VEVDDRVVVATPEGVDVELVVAGLGSRFISSLVDTTLMVVAIIPFLLLGAVLGSAGVAVASLALLVVLFVVPTAFDAFAGGRTPGRRLAGLRLVTDDGGPVGLLPAAVRNLVRPVDFLPSLYTVGVITVFLSDRNQRLGDLAAGTLVVRDHPGAGPGRSARRGGRGSAVPGSGRAAVDPVDVPVGWDVTGVGEADLAVVRSFLGRRDDLVPDARARVAADLARRIEPIVVGPDRRAGDETFLEAVVAAREARRR